MNETTLQYHAVCNDNSTTTKEEPTPHCVLKECEQAIENWKKTTQGDINKADAMHYNYQEEYWCGDELAAAKQQASPFEIDAEAEKGTKQEAPMTKKGSASVILDHSGSLGSFYALM